MEAGGFLRHGISVRKLSSFYLLFFRLNNPYEERILNDFPSANLPDPRKFAGVIWVKEEVQGSAKRRGLGCVNSPPGSAWQ